MCDFLCTLLIFSAVAATFDTAGTPCNVAMLDRLGLGPTYGYTAMSMRCCWRFGVSVTGRARIGVLGVWLCAHQAYTGLHSRGRLITRVGARTRFSVSLNSAHACSLPQRQSVALFPGICGGEVRGIIACGNHGPSDALRENERE